MIKTYRQQELADAGKARIRAAAVTAGVGTEKGSDHGVIAEAAAMMLHGNQVGAAHVYQQILPEGPDVTAQTLSDDMDRLGITFEKSATKARGRMAIRHTASLPVGTRIEFPAASMVDGVARTFVLISAHEPRATIDGVAEEGIVTAETGSTRTRFRVRTVSAIPYIKPCDVLIMPFPSGCMAEVKAIERESSLTLWPPLEYAPNGGAQAVLSGRWSVVDVEAEAEGVAGNCGAARTSIVYNDAGNTYDVQLFSATGGADAEEAQPADNARVAARIADNLAYPPGYGNAQHWREIAMSCPTVALADAIVYRGARGPGTVDIVAIGKSGRVKPAGYDGARLDFVWGGGNQRVLPAHYIAELQAYVNTFAGYHDDILVRPVSWSFFGHGGAPASSNLHFRNAQYASINIKPAYGYGSDCGVVYSSIGVASTDPTRVYAYVSQPVPAALKPGHRIWVRLRSANSSSEIALTVVTTVRAVARDRTYVTVDTMAPLARAMYCGMNPFEYPLVLEWGAAGPLEQAVLDVVYDYFDELGPGSMVIPGYDSGYQADRGIAYPRTFPGVGVNRWPSEGHRWTSRPRWSELRARILGIEGVAGASISAGSLDIDPMAFCTQALGLCIVSVQSAT